MTTLGGLARGIVSYSDLVADATAVEDALSMLQWYLNHGTEHPRTQKESQVKYIIKQMINVGSIRHYSREYIPIDEFYQINFGRHAPSFVRDGITYQQSSAIDDEMRVYLMHKANLQWASILSTLFAPLRYKPIGTLDDRIGSASSPSDFLGLSFEMFMRDMAERAVDYAAKTLEIRQTPWRLTIVEHHDVVQSLVNASADDINALRTRKYGEYPISRAA